MEENVKKSVRDAIERSHRIMEAKYGRDFNEPHIKTRRALIAEWWAAKHAGDTAKMAEIDHKLGLDRKKNEKE